MEYREFEIHINRVKASYEKDEALVDLLGVEGAIMLCDDLIESVLDLLEDYFDDDEGWLTYWMWELDFGREYRDGAVVIAGKPRALQTIQDLYNVLTED